MAFIWNDEEIQFVKPSKEWDENEYVIVNTLYVQINEREEAKEEEVKEFTEKILMEKFSKYGPIETVEIFTHKNTNNNNKQYAYVQFRENKHAFLAYLDTQRKNEPHLAPAFKVIPADTWRQPTGVINSNNNDVVPDHETESIGTTIEDLNEDCLINIFKFCDVDSLIVLSEVNRHFNEILHREILPKFRKFVLNLDRGYKFRDRTDMTLRRIRKILPVLGPYVTEVEMLFYYNNKPRNLIRIFHKFAKYVGPNLKKMLIRELILDDANLNALKSVFKNLEILKIFADNEDFEHDIDFRSFCPNLKKLKLQQNMQFVCCAQQQWLSLENLSMVDNEYMDIDTLCVFMRMNPQLKRLKMTAFSCDVVMQNIGQYLPNLEKLTAYQGFPEISSDMLMHLTGLDNFKMLKLVYISNSNFNDVLGFLPRLSGLQKLKLNLYSDNDRLIVALAKELIELKVLHLAFCQLGQEGVVDFIRSAGALEEFCMHSCGVPLTGRLLSDIAHARKQTRTFYDQPLKLIVDPYSDQEVEQMAKDPEIQRLVKVEISNDCILARGYV